MQIMGTNQKNNFSSTSGNTCHLMPSCTCQKVLPELDLGQVFHPRAESCTFSSRYNRHRRVQTATHSGFAKLCYVQSDAVSQHKL